MAEPWRNPAYIMTEPCENHDRNPKNHERDHERDHGLIRKDHDLTRAREKTRHQLEYEKNLYRVRWKTRSYKLLTPSRSTTKRVIPCSVFRGVVYMAQYLLPILYVLNRRGNRPSRFTHASAKQSRQSMRCIHRRVRARRPGRC